MDLGYGLQASGAEIFRVEEAVNRLFQAYGAQGDVFAVNNCILITLSGNGEPPLTRMRRVPAHGTNLDLMEAYNAAARRLCAETMEFSAAKTILRTTRETVGTYSPALQVLGVALSAAAFCLYRQAGLMDALWAGLCGAAAAQCYNALEKLGANAFFRTILASFAVSLLAYTLKALGWVYNLEAVTIGGQLLLLPGLVFTNFIRDLISGDTNAGLNKMMEALLIAAAIAGGTALALSFAGALFGPMSRDAVPLPWSLPLRCLCIGVTGVGICLLFNVHGPGILLTSLAAMVGCVVNLGLTQVGVGSFGCSLGAAAAISVCAELLARLRKCPATPYLLVAIFPLVPGAGLYRALDYALQGQSQLFLSTVLQTIAVAGCLAVGIMAVSSLVRLHHRWEHRHRGG